MIDCSSYAICYIPVTYLFYSWSLDHLIHFTYSVKAPPSSPLETISLLSVFVLFCLVWFLDSTYKWKHTVFPFLIYFTQYTTLWVHPCCYRWQDFILFYVWVVPLFIYSTSLYIHILLDIKVASISWLLQIIATKNIGVHTSLQIGVFAFSG